MWTLLDSVRRARRGAVAVEFALTFLPILYLFAGVTDLGIAYYREIGLSNAVAAAAAYAQATDYSTVTVAGSSETPTASTVTAANVETVLQDAAAQSMPGVTVTPSAACYSFPVNTTTFTSNSTDAVPCNGSSCVTSATTIKYVEIGLSTTYYPLFPSLSRVGTEGSQPLSKVAWVPLGC